MGLIIDGLPSLSKETTQEIPLEPTTLRKRYPSQKSKFSRPKYAY
jgi:hypothetical protein